MTSSTKPDLVEHVARAIFARKNPAEFLDHMYSYEREDSISSARAAIRATLEYVRDSPTRAMTSADPGTTTTDNHAFYSAKFRAAIDALLLEIDQDGGKGS